MASSARMCCKKQEGVSRANQGGKRKALSSGAKGSGRSSKPKLGASGKLSNEQYQKDMSEKLCHSCHQPDHVAKTCPQKKKAKKGKGVRVAAASGAHPKDEMSHSVGF
jgi:hypothetical protein